ncbi:hypothetical protein [Paractinoplanes atraurantiacus]|uniref:Uncharacterized protein n=1 Tax=Paractinoplanes atraurantiacus TaxID=1036182 RepID=A0A285K4G9_9ACTN|nr:hypothetical protein [Actinoplanes atraurantiacus]SNY67482.1 hypothetical protein SAMN05421748_131124 [Actinoplanes atraurantiacus]
MDEIPRDVAVAVRQAAETTIGYPGALDDVYRRAADRRRRQRYVGAVAGFVAVLMVVGAGFALRTRERASLPVVEPSPAPSITHDRPQRLLLHHAAGSYRSGGRAAVTIDRRERVGELLGDGRLQTYAVAGTEGWDEFTVLDDGRVVALGPRDLPPGVEITDGPYPKGVAVDLVVVGPDGKVERSRNVRQKDRPVVLATATETTAYLWRNDAYYSHDLATGRESLLVRIPGATTAGDGIATAVAYDLASNMCHPQVRHVTSDGSIRESRPVNLPGCAMVFGLRLNRDGDRLAASYLGQDGWRVALLDVEAGRVLIDRQVAATPGHGQGTAVELAWQDDQSVRGAVLIDSGTRELLMPFTVP